MLYCYRFLCVLLLTISPLSSFDIEQLIRPDGMILKAFATPYDNVRKVLIDLIKHEQRSIKIASYFLTDNTIARALKKACQRNVSVTIIVDHSMLTSNRPVNALCDLAATVDLYIFRPMSRGLMHNKFVLFERNLHDYPITWTGSYNITHSAQDYNFENVIISNDLAIHVTYNDLFTQLLEQSTPASTFFTPITTGQTVARLTTSWFPSWFDSDRIKASLIHALNPWID